MRKKAKLIFFLRRHVLSFSKTVPEKKWLCEMLLRGDLCKTKIIINEQTFEIVCTVHGFATVFGLDIKSEKKYIRPRPKKNYFVVDTFKLILKDQLIPDGVYKRSEELFDGFNFLLREDE